MTQKQIHENHLSDMAEIAMLSYLIKKVKASKTKSNFKNVPCLNIAKISNDYLELIYKEGDGLCFLSNEGVETYLTNLSFQDLKNLYNFIETNGTN